MKTLTAHRNALSSLWAFVALNIAFADILGLYTPGVIPAVIEGVVEGRGLRLRRGERRGDERQKGVISHGKE